MKQVFSWIRWKYVVPLTIALAAIIVFFVIFFDPLLARGIEKFGSQANGAKIDVTGLKTKLFAGRIAIANVQVANPDRPMENRVEAGPLAFQIDLSELIGRRVIINDATLKGLTFDTKRKTSGALPKRLANAANKQEEPSAAQKLAEKYKDRFKLNLEGIKDTAKERVDFDAKDLAITKQSDALKTRVQTLPAEWQKRTQDLNVDARLKKAEDDLKSIRETPTKGSEAITAIPASLKKLEGVKKDLDALKHDVDAAKNDVQNQSKELKAGVAGLADAKKKDMDDLMARFNLDFASPERMVEGIIGPMVLERFRTVFHYVQLARKYMPSKKVKEVLPPKPRASGMDIEFPHAATPPTFWLQQAALEGAYESVAASGGMSNLSTDQARVGKPFKLNFSGQQNAQKYSAQATFDHVTDVNKDSVVLEATGLDIKKLVPLTDNAGVDFSNGAAHADLAINLIGDQNIGGQLNLAFTGITFDRASLLQKVGVTDAPNLTGGDKLKADFMRNVATAVEAMKSVSVTGQITGTWSDPNLKITSNMGPAIAGALKNSVGSLVAVQRQQLEAKLSSVLAEQQKSLSAKISGIDAGANGQLSGYQKQIEQKIAEATGINLSGGNASPVPGVKVPGLDKLFKK